MAAAAITLMMTMTVLPAYTEAWERHGGVLNMTYTFDKDGNQISTGNIE